MRFLVAGAGGFIGFHATIEALSRGHTVVALCRRPNRRTEALQKASADVVFCDFLENSPTMEADACIYAAGSSHHGLSLANPEFDLRQNAEGALRFLREVRGGVVLLSSAAVYHGHRGPVDPRTPLSPSFPYAISKLAAERYAEWLRSMERLSWLTIIRLYYAYGPQESTRRLVPRIFAHVRSGEERPFPATAPEGSLIDPLYVKDVAKGLVSAAQGAAKDRILDLCGGEPQFIGQFVRKALSVLGGEDSIEAQPNPAEVPILHWSSPDEAFRDLGLEKRTTFQDSLREAFSWYRGAQEDP